MHLHPDTPPAVLTEAQAGCDLMADSPAEACVHLRKALADFCALALGTDATGDLHSDISRLDERLPMFVRTSPFDERAIFGSTDDTEVAHRLLFRLSTLVDNLITAPRMIAAARQAKGPQPPLLERSARVVYDEIVFDESAFGTRNGDSSFERVVVKADDLEAAAVALQRAGERFMLVDERGTEHDAVSIEEIYGELYTPNYVSPVAEATDGVTMYVDCKGVIWPPMRDSFVRILAEELRGAGCSRATVRALRDDE